MSYLDISAASIEALRARYDTGIAILYSFPQAQASIILRIVAPDGREPRDGASYIVEYRDANSDELQEVLEEDCRLFDSTTIVSMMDDLAEDFLRLNAKKWEMYVIQSGRCSPDECVWGESESGRIEQAVIRDIQN